MKEQPLPPFANRCTDIAPANPPYERAVQCIRNENHEGFHENGSYKWERTPICGKPNSRGHICLNVKDHEGDHWPIQTLKVSEVFYSLQGEGARAGEPSIFVRLQGCSAKHACHASGVVCDTEFESGFEMSMNALYDEIDVASARAGFKNSCKWIVFTGGEPMDQLTPEVLDYFGSLGYKQAIETSGIKLMPEEIASRLDFICCSPKVAEHILLKHFGHLENIIDELRYVRHAGQPGIPQPSLKAKHYYLSPHSDGAEINQANLQHCIKLCLENPQWRLSVQQHKQWRLL